MTQASPIGPLKRQDVRICARWQGAGLRLEREGGEPGHEPALVESLPVEFTHARASEDELPVDVRRQKAIAPVRRFDANEIAACWPVEWIVRDGQRGNLCGGARDCGDR